MDYQKLGNFVSYIIYRQDKGILRGGGVLLNIKEDYILECVSTV